MKCENFSRRSFIHKSAVSAGAVTLSSGVLANAKLSPAKVTDKPPREFWIAGVSQMDLQAETARLMVEKITGILGEVGSYQPDIICMPEVFATSNIDRKLSLSEKLDASTYAMKQCSDFAGQHRCYVICPAYTSENGKYYNSAVVFNREGDALGEYHKIHLTENEIKAGLTPGSLDPPIFQTDFGKIGIQICFDMLWEDGWTKVKEKGAEIVFWPSAYSGGKTVNNKASMYKYVVASATRKNTAKLCDVSGETLTHTGIWNKNYYCAPVNLEKVILHTWPYVSRFGEIRKKYGRKVRITTYHEEEWSIIESLSADVFVSDILKEFDLKTFDQHRQSAEVAQNRAR